MGNLAQNLLDTAARHGDRPALRMDDVGLTYAEFRDAALRVSAFLQQRGVRPGDRVGMVLPNVVSFPVLFDRDSKVSAMYDVKAMPSTVFIDRKGNVRALHKGYKAGDEGEYLNQIRALLKE